MFGMDATTLLKMMPGKELQGIIGGFIMEAGLLMDQSRYNSLDEREGDLITTWQINTDTKTGQPIITPSRIYIEGGAVKIRALAEPFYLLDLLDAMDTKAIKDKVSETTEDENTGMLSAIANLFTRDQDQAQAPEIYNGGFDLTGVNEMGSIEPGTYSNYNNPNQVTNDTDGTETAD